MLNSKLSMRPATYMPLNILKKMLTFAQKFKVNLSVQYLRVGGSRTFSRDPPAIELHRQYFRFIIDLRSTE